ncbi:MAG TPA: ABC transporter substrate-binding protein [Solirubrobacteraceae bacterium]|nr:ABC transporter substrate-binding protein [Solirubrobacteraceae bacterium]
MTDLRAGALRRGASAPGCVALLSLVLGACGGGSSADDAKTAPGTSDGFSAALPSDGQKRGGALKLLGSEGFFHLDPGASYFQLDYMISYATHRSLYYFRPQDPRRAVPDLADGEPVVSADNTTVTVKIKPGIRYGTNETSAITGTEVTSADVKYAFERALNPSVANGYVQLYFPLVGAEQAKGGPISGITTPDDRTVVFKLTKPFAATTARALVMPITIPVPKSYAATFDAKSPNVYDAQPERQAFTGPYMIDSYDAGKSISLVRNPEWDGATDDRPAYLDRIEWTLNTDPAVAGRQIFGGTGLANGDTPTASTIKRFATRAKDRITFTPLGNRYVALNTQKKPFSDLDARKAFAAALDRRAMQLARGGTFAGDIATHFLPPTISGFDEAGGVAGPGADYLAKPGGDPALAASYMRKAGFASGKADGDKILMFGISDSPAKETAQITSDALESLGFDVTLRLLDQSAVQTKFCGVEAQLRKIDVCANAGWLPDFTDPYAMLYANFNGASIVSTNNNNLSLFDDPAVNTAMDDAALVSDVEQRADDWGEIDRALVEKVAGIPFLFDNVSNVVSKDVQGVIAQWNASWDLAYMSLK